MSTRDLEFLLRFRNESDAAFRAAGQSMQTFTRNAITAAQQLTAFNNLNRVVTRDLNTLRTAATNALRGGGASRMIAELRALGPAIQAATRQLAALHQQANATLGGGRGLGGGGRGGGNAITRQLNSIETAAGATGGALGGLRGVIAGVITGATISQLKDYADTYTLMGNRIRLVTESEAELTRVRREVLTVANETRSSLEDTVGLYGRVARSTKQLGASQEDVIRFTRGVNQAFQISGATTAEASASVIQFSQALQSSKLGGDELRSIREQAPRLAQAIADGFKVPIGDLGKLGAAGLLNSQKVFQAVMDSLDEINAEFKTTQATIGQSFSVLENGALTVIGRFDEASGISASLAGSLRFLGESLAAMGPGLEENALIWSSWAQKVKAYITFAFTATNGDVGGSFLDSVEATLLQIVENANGLLDVLPGSDAVDSQDDRIAKRLDELVERRGALANTIVEANRQLALDIQAADKSVTDGLIKAAIAQLDATEVDLTKKPPPPKFTTSLEDKPTSQAKFADAHANRIAQLKEEAENIGQLSIVQKSQLEGLKEYQRAVKAGIGEKEAKQMGDELRSLYLDTNLKKGREDFLEGFEQEKASLLEQISVIGLSDQARQAASRSVAVYNEAIEDGLSVEEANDKAQVIRDLVNDLSNGEAQSKFRESVRGTLTALEQEVAVTGMVGVEREKAIEIMRLEDEQRRANVIGMDEEKQKILELYDALEKKNTAFATGLQAALAELRRIATDEASFARDLVLGTTADIRSEFQRLLKDGITSFKDFGDAVTNVLEGLATRLLDRQFDLLFGMLAGGAGGGGGGGILGSIFGAFGGGGGGSPMAFENFGGLGIAHEGGIAGYLPRYHRGGIAGDEVPAILQKGEGVFTREQMAALGAGSGGGSVNIVVNNTATGVNVSARDNGMANGKREIEIMVIEAVRKTIVAGEMDSTMQATYGVTRRGVPR